MNELMNSIASAGDLASCTSDMRIMLNLFIFMYVLMILTIIIGFLSKLGR